jgi:uncharacterized protein (DUF488 family)
MPEKTQAKTVWTVGHSTRTIQEFLDLLAEYDIRAIADVRSMPGSRKYPQYDQEKLAATLADQGVAYRWLENLGGRRRTSPESPNTAWRNVSFRGYADHMSSAEFAQGLNELHELAGARRTALMCAEAVWWRCHRSMIADALCAGGTCVMHIMGSGHCVAHPMTSPARIVRGQLTYTLP